MFNINQLPVSRLSQVMAFLPPEDLLKACIVCRLWKDVIDSPNVWRQSLKKFVAVDFGKDVFKNFLHPKKAWLHLNRDIPNLPFSFKTAPLKKITYYDLVDLHGPLLTQKSFNAEEKNYFIFDVQLEKQISLPELFIGSSFLEWSTFEGKQTVIAQKNDTLICWEYPFEDSHIYQQNLPGKFLKVFDNTLYYLSDAGKNQLYAWDLKKRCVTSEFAFFCDKQLRIYPSKKYLAIVIENEDICVLNVQSGNVFNIGNKIKINSIHVSIHINSRWLVIVDGVGKAAGKFQVWDLVKNSLHIEGDVPVEVTRIGNWALYCGFSCLNLYRDYLFIQNGYFLKTLNIWKNEWDSKRYNCGTFYKTYIKNMFLFICIDNPVAFSLFHCSKEGGLTSRKIVRLEKIESAISLAHNSTEPNSFRHNGLLFNGVFLVVPGLDKIQYCNFLSPEIAEPRKPSVKKIKLNSGHIKHI